MILWASLAEEYLKELLPVVLCVSLLRRGDILEKEEGKEKDEKTIQCKYLPSPHRPPDFCTAKVLLLA